MLVLLRTSSTHSHIGNTRHAGYIIYPRISAVVVVVGMCVGGLNASNRVEGMEGVQFTVSSNGSGPAQVHHFFFTWELMTDG